MPALNSKQAHVLFLIQQCEFQKNKHCLLLIKQYIHLCSLNPFSKHMGRVLNSTAEVSKNYSCPLQLWYPLCWDPATDNNTNPTAGQNAREKNGLEIKQETLSLHF